MSGLQACVAMGSLQKTQAHNLAMYTYTDGYMTKQGPGLDLPGAPEGIRTPNLLIRRDSLSVIHRLYQ
jgi:hypothetical protein